MRRQLGVHQDVGERGSLRRGVPAVDVERRVRFGDAFGLHSCQRGSEGVTILERREDVIGGAVHDAAKSLTVTAGIVSRTRLNTGTPSMTAPSNRNDTPAAAARSRSRR